jgi:hypothetical protein
MIPMSSQSTGYNRGERLRRDGSSAGRLHDTLADILADVEVHSILNGFFFNTKKIVSINSRYLVR